MKNINTHADASPTAHRGNDAWERCLEHADVFSKSLVFGRVRGIAALVADTQTPCGPDMVELARELIKRDILVVATGQVADAVEKAEQADPALFDQADSGLLDLCEFIGIKPVVYMNRHADHSSMLEFYREQADAASIDPEALPFTVMTVSADDDRSALEPVYGTVFIHMENTPEVHADLLEDYIHDKRLAREWCDRFYCTEVAYS